MTDESADKTYVLVVDDDPDIAKFICLNLESAGYSAVSAGTAPEAWDRIHERMPDLVSTNITMPGPDGYEFVEQLRSTAETTKLGIVILTARALDEDRSRGL